MSAYLRSRWSTGCAPPFESRACHRASAVAASVPHNRNWRTHQDEQYVLFKIRRLSARAHEHWGGRVRQFIRAGASRLLDRSQTGGLTSTVLDRSLTNFSFTSTSRGRKRHRHKAQFTEGPAAQRRRVRDGDETEPRLHSRKWRGTAAVAINLDDQGEQRSRNGKVRFAGDGCNLGAARSAGASASRVANGA